MTKEEIKKALECCYDHDYDSCDDCPYYTHLEDCTDDILKDSLDLITNQEKEIEQLKAENERLAKVVSSKVYDFVTNTIDKTDTMLKFEKECKIDVLNKLKDSYGLYYLSAFGVKERMLADILNPMIEELKK